MNSNKKWLYVLISVILGGLALSYAAVPLYKIYCQTTGYGGTTQTKSIISNIETPKEDIIHIRFESQIDNNIPIKFHASQKEVISRVGESTLVFYSVWNHSDKEVHGIATYNVTPNQTGKYFTKIQCFCFEEQRWKPNEQVEMPILFYIDPEIRQDPSTQDIKEITLSYTLYEIQDEDEE